MALLGKIEQYNPKQANDLTGDTKAEKRRAIYFFFSHQDGALQTVEKPPWESVAAYVVEQGSLEQQCNYDDTLNKMLRLGNKRRADSNKASTGDWPHLSEGGI